MSRVADLDRQWQRLMSLCDSESRLRSEGRHPRLLELASSDIGQLARDMGFSPRQIATREFRARRDGNHIIAIVTE
jgi:hypothetical protein